MTKLDAQKEGQPEPNSAGYQIIQSLGRTAGSSLFRVRCAPNDVPALLKRLDDKSEPARIERFRAESELFRSLNVPGIPHLLAPSTDGSEPAMMIEDPLGHLLESSFAEPMSIAQALRFGIQLASSLSGLHDQQIVHRDLRPANVLVSRVDDRITIVDLSWAAPVGRGDTQVHDDLAYISPEQTLRTDRPVDARSDLYSLGVILYRMLSGRLPFVAADALEWMHCHLARAPLPLVGHAPVLPEAVCAVVAKLLAKSPGDRYQSGRGVAHDLARCLAGWEAGQTVPHFSLGSQDTPDRLAISEELLGRESQLAELRAAWARIRGGGAAEVVLVSGYSGIGKTSLVNDLRGRVLDAGGFFLTAKFDQCKRDIPYASFTRASHSLVQQLLGGSEAQLQEWRRRLGDALGVNGRFITAVIPDVQHIIGPQPSVSDTSAQETRHRFQAAFQKFLGVFAGEAHPLVLFIDDLQWLDPASLTLLEYLATRQDGRHLLIVGAYRDNEVTPAHPLRLTLDAIRRAGTRISTLPIGAMSRDDVAVLVGRALRTSAEAVAPLAEVVHDKTGGNPFFAIQFLISLHEEGVIKLDRPSGEFRWSMAELRARSVTDNVVDLLLVKLRRLSPATQVAIVEMACLGNRVETAVLAAAHGGTEEEAHAALAEAVQAGLVFRSNGSYRFLHDRVQEAGYALLPYEQRAGTHLGIARRLSARLSREQLADYVFDLAGQWQRGAEGLTDAAEIAALIQLYSLAGSKAKASAAYASARAYYASAVALLPGDAWSSCYDTALDLHLALAECECLNGAYGKSAELLDLTLVHARTDIDRARACSLRLRLGQLAGEVRHAVEAMLDGLRALGMSIPLSDEEAASAARDELRDVARLLEARRAPGFVAPQASSDSRLRAQIELLDEGQSAVFIGRPNLWPFIALRAVSLRLKYGETTRSRGAYVGAATAIASVTGDMSWALEVSEIAVGTPDSDPRDLGTEAGRLIAKHAAMVHIWCRHFETSLPLLEKALRACIEVGDFVFAGYLSFNVVWLVFESGASLESVSAAARRWAAIARDTHNDAMGEVVRAAARFVGRLRGIYDIDSSSFDFREKIAKMSPGFNVGVSFLLAMQQMTAFLEGRYERAWHHTEAMVTVLPAVRLLAVEASHHTFRGLTAAALYADAGAERRRELLQAVADEVRRHERWRKHGPDNFTTRHALLSAELARLEGRWLEAEHLYEDAIVAARQQQFIHYEGLASELASRFYRARGLLTIADAYLLQARACYGRWGAAAKVNQLDAEHPQLVAASAPAPGSSSVGIEALDMLAVIKASQAISQQLVQSELITTLMRVVLESAGADTAALLLPQGAELTMAAWATVEGPDIVVRQSDDSANGELPLSVLNYVRRSKERVLLTDVSRSNPFSSDEHFLRRAPKSLLCLPIVLQTELVGLLYLESSAVANAFPPHRVEMLTLLAGQAAISLQHTRLYADLQHENLERKQAEVALRESQDLLQGIVDNSRALIYVKDLDGRFLLVNRHLAEVLQRGRDSLLGKTDFDLFPLEQATAYRQVDLRALNGGTPVEAEEVARVADGLRTYLSVKAPLFDLNGKAYGLCGISTDITERKRAEAALRQKEEELRQAQKMEAIGNLAGGVAHDFNNLLTVILGSAELLAAQLGEDDPSESDVQAIREAGQRAVSLTRQLLAFSRKQILQPQVVDLNGIVSKIEVILRRLIGEDIELTVVAGIAVGPVLVDPGQVEQILMNLAVNARDAMPTGGTLTIETRNVMLDESYAHRTNSVTPGPYAMLCVRDTGVGMDEATQSRIFEPFFTTKGLGKGTGLGLSTVFGIVQQSGGTLDVKSEVGRGTSFEVYFPHAAPPRRGPSKSTAPDDSSSVGGSETILLVEDDNLVRALARTLLKDAGYQVLEAATAELALALAERHSGPIHLLLTDVVLPRLGGRQLADRFGALLPATKVLFMSGYTNDSILRHGVVDSAVELLQKPFTRVSLLRRVRSVLDG